MGRTYINDDELNVNNVIIEKIKFLYTKSKSGLSEGNFPIYDQ